MKEKEARSNLTPRELNPTLEVGSNFMAGENGEGAPKTPEETVRHLEQIKAEQQPPTNPEGFPGDWDSTPLDVRKAWIEHHAESTDTSRASEYTAIKPDGSIGFYVKEGHLTPEQAKEFVKLFEGKNLTPEQLELKDKLYEALQSDPAGFAKMLIKAVDSLNESDLESILKAETDNLIDLYIAEVEKQAGDKINPKLLEKYKQRAEAIKSLPPHLARTELQKLIKNINSQRAKAEKGEASQPEGKDYERMEIPELIQNIRDTVSELSKAEKESLKSKFAEIQKLGEEEQKARLIELVSDMEHVFQDKERKIDREMDRLMRDLSEDEPALTTREDVLEQIAREKEASINKIRDKMIEVLDADLSDAFNEFGNSNNILLGMVAGIAGTEGMNSTRQQIESIKNDNSLSPDQKKQRLSEIINSVTRRALELQTPKNPDVYNPVDSVQELARFIAKTQNAELWGVDGIYPLIDKEEKFHPENLVKWVREQSVLLHTSNPNDQISPLGSVHVRVGLGDVNLIEMILVNKQKYFRDEETGEIMEELANDMLNQAWLFGIVRNSDLVYRQTMNEDKKLPEVVGQIHSRSDLTRSTNLKDILTMAAEFGSGEINEGRAVMFANEFYYNIADWEKLTEIVRGEELSRGGTSLEEQSGLVFTKDDFRDAIRILQKKKDWEDIDSLAGFYDTSESDRFYYMDSTGEKHDLFDGNRFDIKTFVNHMNFYNYANSPQTMFNLVKELVRLKASEKYGLEAGIARTEAGKQDKKLQWERVIREQMALGRTEEEAEKAADRRLLDIERYAQRVNLTFAENIGEHFQRAYGGGARNDVSRRGYDAATKGYLTDYLLRQSEAVRAGPTGVRESIGIYRNVIPDMWSALKTETGYSPMEIFTEIREIENIPHEQLSGRYLQAGKLKGSDSNPLTQQQFDQLSDEDKNETIEKARQEEIKEWTDKLKFNQGAERDIAGNVKMRGFQLLHSFTGGERLDINKMVTYDPLQGVLIDLGYVEEHFNDGFIKPARYFGNTNGGMKFSSTLRRQDIPASIREKYPVYEEVTLAEASYGPEVIQLVKDKWAKEHDNEVMDFRNLTDDQKAYLEKGGRMDMVKFGLALNIAAELRHHRHFGGPGAKWGYVRTEAFFSLLKHMEELEEDPDNPGRVRVKLENGKPLRFFDDDLMKLMREKSDSKSWKLLTEDLGVEMGGPALSSLIEIIARTAAYTIKT